MDKILVLKNEYQRIINLLKEDKTKNINFYFSLLYHINLKIEELCTNTKQK